MKPINRRAFLGTAGTLITLPFLESLLPRTSRASATVVPQRFLTFYFPNGAIMDYWTPTSTGAGYTMPTSLAPLAPYQSNILVLTNVSNMSGASSPDPGDHGRGTGSFLNAVPVAESQDYKAGISVDQAIANAIGGATAIPSLQLGCTPAPTSGTCDNAYSCVYTNCISWADPVTPLLPQVDPAAAFSRLFTGADPTATAAEQALRLQYRMSVLDAAAGQTQTLMNRLSSVDKQKLDQYFTGIRALETQLAKPIPASCNMASAPVPATTRSQLAQQMVDLMVLALQCDLTRVISFMLDHGQSDLVYDWLNLTGGHHSYTHAIPDATTATTAIPQIVAWEMGMFASLIKGLQAVTESDGSTLFDNTLLFCSTEIGHNFDHDHTNMPLILAGGGGGLIKPGRHYMYDPNNRPDFGNLFVSFLNAFGVQATSFGNNYQGPITAGLQSG